LDGHKLHTYGVRDGLCVWQRCQWWKEQGGEEEEIHYFISKLLTGTIANSLAA
jgi:hypothetical protein